MRPAPISDDKVPPQARRVVVMPPGDNLDTPISPVEAVVYTSSEGVKLLAVRCVMEDDDLERLASGEAVWITFFENIVPFDVSVRP